MSDIQTLRSYAATRDAQAFTSVVRQHQGLVYGTCLRILGDHAEAEDAAQECFLALARKAGDISKSVAGWLHCRASQDCISRLRKGAARRRREREYAARRPGSSADRGWDLLSSEIDGALEQLPEQTRHLLIEHFLRGRSQADIAADVGLSPAAVSRRISAGVDELRNRLQQSGTSLPCAAISGFLGECARSPAPTSITAVVGKVALAGVGPATKAVVLTGWLVAAACASVALLVAAGAFLFGGGEAPAVAGAHEQKAPAVAGDDAARPNAATEKPLRLFEGVWVRWGRKELILDSTFALAGDEPLEYAACPSRNGKLHESVLATVANPAHVCVALLLLGLQPGGGVAEIGGAATPAGDRVELFVERDGHERVPIDAFVFDVKAGRPAGGIAWVFTGGRFVADPQTRAVSFAGSGDGVLAALYRDPAAVLNIVGPAGADDTTFRQIGEAVGPVGTGCRLVVSAAARQKVPAAADAVSLTDFVNVSIASRDYATARVILGLAVKHRPAGAALDNLLYLHFLVARHQGDEDTARDAARRLVTEFPGNEYSLRAQEALQTGQQLPVETVAPKAPVREGEEVF
jgi:RNA polymerase sigma factor (sigma-70 family)